MAKEILHLPQCNFKSLKLHSTLHFHMNKDLLKFEAQADSTDSTEDVTHMFSRPRSSWIHLWNVPLKSWREQCSPSAYWSVCPVTNVLMCASEPLQTSIDSFMWPRRHVDCQHRGWAIYTDCKKVGGANHCSHSVQMDNRIQPGVLVAREVNPHVYMREKKKRS